jgi:hypothetical protein
MVTTIGYRTIGSGYGQSLSHSGHGTSVNFTRGKAHGP